MALAMPRRAAPAVSAASKPSGGCRKCSTGSDTPKNIRPMPVPAANSMANQVDRE